MIAEDKGLPGQEGMQTANARALSLTVIVPVYNERHLVKTSIERVLAMENPMISRLEVLAVDDGSTDGSWDVLQSLVKREPRLTLFQHLKNRGKGAAIQTALEHATGDVCVIHDADLEYDPQDIPSLLKPFLESGADAVFGSRYLASQERRVLTYRHTILNKCVTALVNLFTDLDVSDVETCYKAVQTELMKTIPIRSRDFRFEVEIAIKLARRRARIFEVPVHYQPRTYEEGKKIRFYDGLLAIAAILKYWIVEDIFHQDNYGLKILMDMKNARRFNKWMGDTLRPFLGHRILEIGSGLATMTSLFIPRTFYVASDLDKHALHYLKGYSIGKPYLKVLKVNAESTEDFASLHQQLDTVVIVNVLEHVKDEKKTLNNIYRVLAPGGKIVVLVPQYQWLYGSLDAVVHHRERYSREKLRKSLEAAGFQVETLFDFNRFCVPSWFLNAKILKRKRFSRIQLKVLEVLVPLIRLIDRFLPWGGLSLIAVGVKQPPGQVKA